MSSESLAEEQDKADESSPYRAASHKKKSVSDLASDAIKQEAENESGSMVQKANKSFFKGMLGGLKLFWITNLFKMINGKTFPG